MKLSQSPWRSALKTRLACAAALLAAGPSAALAHGYTVGAISVVHPWARATDPTATTGEGYMSITNNGDTDDTLISASTPVALGSALHQTLGTGEATSMVPAEGGIPIPAGATIALEPGGPHVMFQGLSAPLEAGDMEPLTLVFEKAGPVLLDLEVERIGTTQLNSRDARKAS